MPTAQRTTQTGAMRSTSFSYHASAQSVARARAAAPLAAPEVVAPPQAVRSRRWDQTLWHAAMVLAAVIVVAVGFVYLYGRVCVEQESYRQVRLQRQLRREQERAQQFSRQEASINAAFIEHNARLLGMIPPDEKNVVTLR